MRTVRLLLTVVVTLSVLLGGLVTPAYADEAEACSGVYKVKRGDSLYKIASICQTTVDAILRINPQIKNPSRIYTGQEIKIPNTRAIRAFIAATNARASSPKGFLEVNTRVSTDNLIDGERDETNIRWIDVNLTNQTVTAYEGSQPVRTFLVSTGTARFPTVTGAFYIYRKHEKIDMRGPGYHQKDVPWTMYFYRGYGLHGTYWHNRFGTRMSHGCVNLRVEDAKWLYEFAPMGTLVLVHN
jgi:lipoprotein-anchoring transpeptidase ErfK/SrfK